MALIRPSAQAKKGDGYLEEARSLRDQWGQLIPSNDLIALQSRITMSVLFVFAIHTTLFTLCMPRATEMRHGMDGKIGLSKIVHARTYRKYSQETLRVVKVLSLYSNVYWD
jgi:hypothetical protein